MNTNIKKLRENKHISQAELAKKLNIAPSTLCQYEKGNREADYETLIKFADFFDTTVDYILGRSMFANNPHNIKPEDVKLAEIWCNLTSECKWQIIGCAKMISNEDKNRS